MHWLHRSFGRIAIFYNIVFPCMDMGHLSIYLVFEQNVQVFLAFIPSTICFLKNLSVPESEIFKFDLWNFCVFPFISKKFPETWWIKRTHLYSFTVLEGRSPKSVFTRLKFRCWQGCALLGGSRGQISSLPLPGSSGFENPLACHITPVSASVVIPGQTHPLSLTGICLHLGPTLIIQDNLFISSSWIHSPLKDTFPNKVAFTDSRD